MAENTISEAPAEPERQTEQGRWPRWLPWHRLALGGILLVAAFLNFYELGAGGYDSYYPPAIRSMMDSWHNFFFASYDPGGFVTIDKPPLGFWFDVLSAKIFGFNQVSILLPQALAGMLSVLLLYYLVRRHFGVVAGLLAALALAITPTSVVTNRDTTIDSILVLFLLVGAWAVIRAAETGRLRWLLLSALMVGLGFNVKMMEAYLVVPAFAVLYLVAAPGNVWKRLGYLGLAALVLLVVSFSWIVAVDLTPASQRPYVDSTTDDSELSLALGYNGIERLLGIGSNTTSSSTPTTGVPGGRSSGSTPQPVSLTPTPGTTSPGRVSGNNPPSASSTATPGTNSGSSPSNSSSNSTSTSSSVNSAPTGLFDIGKPGLLRLFQESLGSQVSWLLPLAFLGLLALAWRGRPRIREDLKLQSLLLWGMWVLTMGIFFSVASFFHQYYLTMMAPGLVALVGIGLVTMWQDYQLPGWRGWLLPVALIATLAEQIYLLRAYPAWASWMIPLICASGLLVLIVLLGTRSALLPGLQAVLKRVLWPALGLGLIVLLFAPFVWSTASILLDNGPDALLAGPPTSATASNGGGTLMLKTSTQTITVNLSSSGDADTAQTKLIRYLEANQGQTKFLVATPGAQSGADSIIIATNKPVMALGGFSNDPILTTSQLNQLVKDNTVRFFLIQVSAVPQQVLEQLSPQQQQALRTASPGEDQLTGWVEQHCQTVAASQWQSSGNDTDQLYDCSKLH